MRYIIVPSHCIAGMGDQQLTALDSFKTQQQWGGDTVTTVSCRLLCCASSCEQPQVRRPSDRQDMFDRVNEQPSPRHAAVPHASPVQLSQHWQIIKVAYPFLPYVWRLENAQKCAQWELRNQAAVKGMSGRLHDILAGITSPADGHLGWFLGRRVFRMVEVDVNRNRISTDENTQ